jgi:hypothetical protein
VTEVERKAERQAVVRFMGEAGAEDLVRHLRRRWRDGPPGETGEQMINRLGRLDALADIERLREEAKKGT